MTRLAAAWFGGAAIAVQVLLPLLLAAEIRLADAGGLPIGAERAAAVSGIAHHRHGTAHHHDGNAATCPICQAAAAGQAFTAPTMAAVLLPRGAAPAVFEAAPPRLVAARFSLAFRARAPPIAI